MEKQKLAFRMKDPKYLMTNQTRSFYLQRHEIAAIVPKMATYICTHATFAK